MRIRVLGSGAGGGLPQWNCGCANCRAARAGEPAVRARTQSSIALTADGERWVLCNASPDVRTQLNAFAPLAPPAGQLRGSGVSAVLLTNADIDHCAGLLVLREGGAPPIYGTERVRAALTEGLSILPVLAAYGPVEWRGITPGEPFALRDRGGNALGIRARAFAVASKPPPYMTSRGLVRGGDDLSGDTVGVVFESEVSANGGRPATLAYVPGVRDLDDALAEKLARADVILIDGTFYTDDEMVALGASSKTARTMGHAPLSGPGGLLDFLGRFPRARRVFLHINNTNPMLVAGSDAERAVRDAGVEIAHDGLEIAV